VIPLVETAKSIVDVGTLDYALDLDLTGDDRGLLYPACRTALASRAAGICIARCRRHTGDRRRIQAPGRSRDCMGETYCGRSRIGAVQVDGRTVDRPVIASALRILTQV